VGTTFRVLSSSAAENGNIVTQLEVSFGEGHQSLSQALSARGTTLPQRVVLNLTQSPDGTLVSAQTVEGPAALAESLARQAIQALPRAAPAVEGAAAGGTGAPTGAAAGAAAAVARVSPWVRGIAWGGLALFVVVTGVRLALATPEQRPRVATTAAGGFVGAAAASYLVCNLVLGIETLGWSLLICGFIVGIPSGMAGSAVAGAIYDDATATPVERALHDLESTPENTRRLFFAMVAQAGGRGIPITEDFIRSFLSTVPRNLRDDERDILIGQLRAVGPGSTLADVLRALRHAIEGLPGRAPIVLPPILDATDLMRAGPRRVLIDTLGNDRIRVFPSPVAPVPGQPSSPAQPAPSVPILEIRL
jgi:hypothetical protein